MTLKLQSAFADKIEDFIKQKNALGFPYESFSNIMKDFDRFCCERFPEAGQLTQEICLSWAIRRKTELSNNSFRNRLMPVREFARYLNRIGEEAYVLHTNFAKKEQAKIPYIYSIAEIKNIWDVLDNMIPNKRFPVCHLVLPTAIKLLYCCGLRPCEVRRLTVDNVDLNKGRLNILESKQHKSRVVMVADDVKKMLTKYNSAVSSIIAGRTLFFPTSHGTMYSEKQLCECFRTIREKANLTRKGNTLPRLYDFRHTFATHRLYYWMKEGKDLYSMIPYLSAYMGHALITDTFYYIHFVPGMAESMSGCSFMTGEKLIPIINESSLPVKKLFRMDENKGLNMSDFDFSFTEKLIPGGM